MENRGTRNTLTGRAAALGMIIALTVSGCASLGLSQTPEEAVKSRAQARLDALMQGDFEKAFSYLAPALRDVTTMQRHGSRYAGVVYWRAATVDSVVCEPERCDVKYSVTYRMVRPKIESTRSMDEVWIEAGGTWYLYDK